MSKAAALPEAISEWGEEGWTAFDITGPARVLVLGDTHIPFHDKTAITCVIAKGKAAGCDTVLINGDAVDMYAMSAWVTDPRLRNFGNEIEAGRQFLAYLRGKFPKARIFWKLGNHEERHEAYFLRKAPELLGIDDFSIESLYRTANYGVEMIRDMRVITMGALNVIHGHEYRWAISNPVNPARGLFLRAKANALTNHHHQSSQHSERSIDQTVLSTWSVGCLCQMNPRYRPINNWNHGAAMVEINGSEFDVNNGRIFHGKWY